MITFKKIYESIFHSFRVNGASILLWELKQEGIEKAIIVQRSWIYGLFVNIIVVILIILMIIQFYLKKEAYTSDIFFDTVSVVLFINTIGLIISGFFFLRFYKKNHKRLYSSLKWEKESEIEPIINIGDHVFTHFFNQMTGSYFIAIILLAINLYYYVFISPIAFGFLSFGDVCISVIQVVLMAYYRRRIIDLQMDYIIVIPGRVYFIDQTWVYKRVQTLRWYANIRLITSSFPNFFASLLNYGSIEIITKNDFSVETNVFHMHYIDNPIEIVNQMNQFLKPT